ncbi:metacestode specific membrane protein 1 [Echinococcus multilocularis]|uniref:Metacestode specific membrane protein 1 n=1 Tax=Echinococcus multilocularis TaxID=6211 RepID=Q8I7B9_ECHMU|nr:metacestode specific membrane protein 1 [Echinococcus multilocularis]CDS36436.1 metacestode specific membrane protein 1 [Echinococcus multilocularis]
MPFTSTRLPTALSSDDLAKRDKFRKSLKLAFSLLGVTAVVILAIGIYVLVDPGRYNYSLVIFGYVLISLAIACFVASVITGNLLLRLIHSISETKVFRPKSADALQAKPYPRQPKDGVRHQRAVVRISDHQTRPQPQAISQELRREDSGNGVISNTEGNSGPQPIPSAPPAGVSIGAGRNNNTNEEQERCEKMIPSPPDLEMPPPFAPPPSYPPPAYEDVAQPLSMVGKFTHSDE